MPPELRGGGGAGETTCRGREKGVKRVETKERKKKIAEPRKREEKIGQPPGRRRIRDGWGTRGGKIETDREGGRIG